MYTMQIAAQVSAHLRDTQTAAALRELLLPYSGQIVGIPVSPLGSVAHYLGLLAATLGRFEDAEQHFAAADATNQRIGAPAWLARTRLEWARMLLARGGTGDMERARELLRQALSTARELGLARVEQRAAALLGGVA
jgi:tetratricopeptide (TPR) repeat protein